jgi:hypothetical protein
VEKLSVSFSTDICPLIPKATIVLTFFYSGPTPHDSRRMTQAGELWL